MSLATNLSNLTTRIATEIKALRTLVNGNATDLSGLTTTTKTHLVAAINEVNAKPSGGGGASSLSGLSDVTVVTPATGHLLRYDGAKFVNVAGSSYYEAAGAAAAAQAASQPLDTDLTAIAALATTAFGRNLLALADGVGLANAVANSSETVSGTIEIATQAETNTGTDDVRAITPLKLQTRLAAFAQPLDSDLTAIAALATTTYGRALLTLADQAGLMALVPVATTAAQGKVQLATSAESQTGTDAAKATTAAGTKAAIDQRIVNDATLASNSTTNAPSVASVKSYADGLLDAANAFQYKGVIDCSTNPNYPAASAGWTYKVSVAGKIGGPAGPNVEVGDTIVCLVDGSASGTHAVVGANWIIMQTNIDGAVVGPATSVAGNLPTFSGTSGKIIQDSGFSISTAAISGNSTTIAPTQSAVYAAVNSKQNADATLTALGNLTTAANQIILATGVDTFTMLTTGATGRALLADATAADARTELSVYSQAEIGNPETDLVAVFNAGLV